LTTPAEKRLLTDKNLQAHCVTVEGVSYNSTRAQETDEFPTMFRTLQDDPETMGEAITNTAQAAEWSPDSWRSKPIKQCPDYPDKAALAKSVSTLQRLPPIVHPSEIVQLKNHLRDVAQGKAFLLQGGDCAELFDYCQQDAIESKIKLLLQMSLVLVWGANKRVVRIGRMAGQYAKPRSSPMETVDGREVPSFRGDILNGFHVDERQLDPDRLVRYVSPT
jgi:3-deoxy-7-phosphoheptulonate synthase